MLRDSREEKVAKHRTLGEGGLLLDKRRRAKTEAVSKVRVEPGGLGIIKTLGKKGETSNIHGNRGVSKMEIDGDIKCGC